MIEKGIRWIQQNKNGSNDSDSPIPNQTDVIEYDNRIRITDSHKNFQEETSSIEMGGN